MAAREVHGRSFRWDPVTIISALRLVCFSVLIIVFWQCANSSAIVLNNTAARVPQKVDQRLLGIHKRLRAINKPAVKTIQSPDGDIIDCILRDKQLTFDDPLLRNHTIQEFSTIASGIRLSSIANRTSRRPFQIWHLTGVRCPKGTIPVRRISAEDLIRYDSHRLYDQKKFDDQFPITGKPKSVDDGTRKFNREYATLVLHGGQYYGTAMISNIWNPQIEDKKDMSISQMWIAGAVQEGPDVNTIETGWQVHPLLYGDARTRLFIYWTRDRYRFTGCYNLECAGFVQTNQNIALGAAIATISSAHAQQYDMVIIVSKDARTGNWWLYLGNYGRIGYFPSSIFTFLASHAVHLEWGGEVGYFTTNGEHTNVQMGSGRFPQYGFGLSSYIRNLYVISANRIAADVSTPTFRRVTAGYCYNIKDAVNVEWGKHFYFGGPGLNPSCS